MTTSTQPTKFAVTLVDFRYGDPGAPDYYRVCDDTRDTAYGTDVYVSRPALAVRGIKLTGGLNEKPTEIDLPWESGEFADLVSRPDPFSIVHVRVRELEVTDDGASRVRTLFLGRVHESARNPDGVAGKVRLYCLNSKSDMDYPLGLAAYPTCVWNLGGAGCDVDLAPHTVSATLISRDGLSVVIDDGGGPSGPLRGKAAGFWVRGYIRRGGTSVRIKDWTTGSTAFVVGQPLPAAWEGELVTVVPGCDQRRTTCDTRWANLARFAGVGIAIPAHNPQFEVPQ